MTSIVVAVSEASQVGGARRAASMLAERAGLDGDDAGRVALIATELATNLVRHARGGQLLLRAMLEDGRGVELVSLDRGPGMASVERCMVDGYSSLNSPGTGLGAIRRSASEFDVHSAQPSGTVIAARVFAAQRPDARSSAEFWWGVVSIPVRGETECGDAWAVVEHPDHVTFVVADGLGHGCLAAEASNRVLEVTRAAGDAGPGRVLDLAHHRLHGSRGAAVAVGNVARTTGALHYAGIGNISTRIVSRDGGRSLISNNGTVGSHMSTPKEFEYVWPTGGLLISHSDGLTTRWDLTKDPHLAARDPAVIAGVLYRDHSRNNDDVTVLVGRKRARVPARSERE
jgi:anti-sigma regulatory factor (Ser/Thr protein kinase)